MLNSGLADVLDKLVNHWAASRIDDLMPWAWAKLVHPIAPAPDEAPSQAALYSSRPWT